MLTRFPQGPGRGRDTHENHGTCPVNGIQKAFPVGVGSSVGPKRSRLVAGGGLEPARESSDKTARDKVKADSDEGEYTESGELQVHAGSRQVLAGTELGGGIAVCDLRGRDHDGPYELEEEREDIKTDEDGRQPTRWFFFLVSRRGTGGGRRSSAVVLLITWYPEELDRPGLGRDNEENDAAEDDVDDAGHDDWCQDDQAELKNVDDPGRDVMRGCRPRAVPNGLHRDCQDHDEPDP